MLSILPFRTKTHPSNAPFLYVLFLTPSQTLQGVFAPVNHPLEFLPNLHHSNILFLSDVGFELDPLLWGKLKGA
jgi:hypothetical protein